jgi:hypothetical protein
MKVLFLVIFTLSVFLSQAQISSNTTDTVNVSVTITPSGFHGRSNGLKDTTNVALGAKASQSTNDSYPSYNNTMLGIKALNRNQAGIENLAMGNNTLLYFTNNSYNTIIGVESGISISGNDYLTSIGYSTFTNNVKSYNLSYGANAMRGGTNYQNNAIIGANAIFNNSNLVNSTVVGSNALFNTTSGSDNSIVGAESLYTTTYVTSNTSVGIQNFKWTNSAAFSVAIGALALDSVSVSNGLTAIGANSLLGLSTGNNDVAVGYKSLIVGAKSKNNIGIGAGTLQKSKEGEDNVAIGVEALGSITTSRNNTAIGAKAMHNHNGAGFLGQAVAIGYQALFSNTTGTEITAAGTNAMYHNITGSYNTALGYYALFSNTSGIRNLALGFKALFANTTGTNNVGAGTESLFSNTTGLLNVAIGVAALRSNSIGWHHTALGNSALYNFSGDLSYNLAVGERAGYELTTGNNSVFLGSYADASGSNFSNVSAIGAHTIVNDNNKVRFGDSHITVIEGQVPFSSVSDIRLKENVVYTSCLGLNFIMGLHSVSYQYKADKTHKRYDGFIAQDIEELMQDLSLPFSGLKKALDGTYSLAYSDFIIPLVNARKEQQIKLADLKKEIAEVKKELDSLMQKAEITKKYEGYNKPIEDK